MGQIYGKTARVTGAGSRAGRAEAIACAPLGLDRRENAVAPSIIAPPIWQKSVPRMMDTMTEELAAPSDANRMDVDAIGVQPSPKGPAGSPDEVVKLIVFGASHAFGYFIGQEHCIDGAMTAR
jgi:NAD(P)-dependent dehydrogenase (short-subunit alcohol dehydrogenase family)